MTLSGCCTVDLLVLFIGLLTLLYIYLKRIYSYWDRKEFKSLRDVSLLFGHFRGVLTQKESIGHFCTRVYRSTNEPFLGVYGFLRPMLLINDSELVRAVLIKDFAHFADRGVYCSENDPLSGHLFALSGQKWKNLRGKLTPTFTSGKLKAMFSTLMDCGSTLQNYLDNLVIKGEVLDVREIAARHSINVIASVGFGIDVDTFSNPKHEFRENLRKVFASSFWNGIRFFLKFTAPKLMGMLRIKTVDQEVEDFILKIVKENLEYREQNNVSRKDFFQLLVQLRNGDSIQRDDQWKTVIKADESQKTMTLNEIAAQAFVFFAAGFETSSTTLSYCLYELAKQPEIQKRVRNEIDEVLRKNDGEITYESVSDMKYLEKCIDETLRKYPVLPMLNRTCVKKYKIPGTNKFIEKGVEVFIPVLGLQNDKNFYENPDDFNPERWNERNTTDIVIRPYLPFGDGPRNCIGMRLGKMQTKVGLVLMLQKFNYELEQNQKNVSLEFDPRHFLLQPQSNIYLKISKAIKM